jgi:hypothetical protein
LMISAAWVTSGSELARVIKARRVAMLGLMVNRVFELSEFDD